MTGKKFTEAEIAQTEARIERLKHEIRWNKFLIRWLFRQAFNRNAKE